MLLTGLHGFITGAGTGIGRAIALEMVREGADLAITDLDLASAQKVAGEAQALRADARVWAGQLDVRATAGSLFGIKVRRDRFHPGAGPRNCC